MNNLEKKIRDMVLEKSAVIEFVTWQDDAGEDNYAYLMFEGKDFPKYQAAIKSGELTLEDWGVFYQGKGKKPSNDELKVIELLVGKDNLKIKGE